MKSVAIVLLAALIILLPMEFSFAADDFFIEVGGDVAKEKAAAQWQSLVAAHKALLGGLHFYPKTVMQGGSDVAVRIQAGPLANKAQAEKICAKLFAGHTPCFVIEGLNEAPPATVASLSERSEERPVPPPVAPEQQAFVQLPWLNEPQRVAQAAPPGPKHRSGFFPWLFGDSEPEPAPIPAPAPVTPALVAPKRVAGDAQVDVAEAIRVPLSETQNVAPPPPTVVIHNLPDMGKREAAPAQTAAAAPQDTASGWLSVEFFGDEESASSFWQEVRGVAPDKTARLRVRINRPMLSRGGPNTALNVGPFANAAAANAFCRDVIAAPEKGLRCRFGEGLGMADASPSNDMVAPHYSHSDGYAVRRQTLMEQRAPANPAMQPTQPPSGTIYWVEVINAPDQMTALRQWEDMRTANPDLLGNARSNISASLSDRTHYIVRVGPVTLDADAVGLCGSLKARGVNCRVLMAHQ